MLCSICSCILVVILCLKWLLGKEQFQKDMSNAVLASVFGTYSMALMVLSGFIASYSYEAGYLLWLAGVGIHVMLIVYFTGRFLLNPQKYGMHASWFIVYVGLAAACINASLFKQQQAGVGILIFSAVSFVLLLGYIVYFRLKNPKAGPKELAPLECIFAAPASLCLVAYYSISSDKNLWIITLGYAAACLFYIYAIVRFIQNFQKPFHPSISAFTFPFVISAIASKQTMANLEMLNIDAGWLFPVVLVQMVLAVALTLIAWYRYGHFVFTSETKKAASAA
jgi:exfoliative toxin A/B